MAGHKHAALMAEYAKDAAEHEQPWGLWEHNHADRSDTWRTLASHPLWHIDAAYRRKPRTITINGVEVPEPLRVAPAFDTDYFVVKIHETNFATVWTNDSYDQRVLAAGLAHLTYEAAEIHTNALLSFTKQ
jgi:hypothetical protein